MATKVGEGLVGGDDVGVDGVGDLLCETLLVFRGDGWRVLLCRDKEWVGIDDALALDGEFLDEEADRHEFVLDAGAEDFGGLAKDARDLVKAGYVVFVVLDGVERDRQRQIREPGMNAVLLVDRHFVLFEVEVGDALLKDTNEEVVGELVLVGEACGADGLEAAEEGLGQSCGAERWRRVSNRRACRCSGSRRRQWRARGSCGGRTRTARRRGRSAPRGGQ